MKFIRYQHILKIDTTKHVLEPKHILILRKPPIYSSLAQSHIKERQSTNYPSKPATQPSEPSPAVHTKTSQSPPQAQKYLPHQSRIDMSLPPPPPITRMTENMFHPQLPLTLLLKST